MLEKRFKAVPPQLFTASGGTDGQITVVDTTLFKVKQQVIVNAAAQPTLELEVKEIDSINTMYIGPKGNINARQDLSLYTPLSGATIMANLQNRPSIPFEETTRAVYEEEPVVAYRVIGVNQQGGTINWSEDGLVPQEFDDVKLTRDIDGDITEAVFYLRGTEIRDLHLTYDINKDVIEVKKVGP